MAISKNQVKLITSLFKKKYRLQNGLFIAEGRKIVKELLKSSFKLHSIYSSNPEFTIADDSKFYQVSEKELKSISQLSVPDELLALFEIPNLEFNRDLATKNFIPVLDEIKDPGNLGTMIRIADWFGFDHLICSNESVDVFNHKVVQSTMGSIARVNVYYADLPHLLKGSPSTTPIYACSLGGENIYDFQPGKNGFFIIGSESHGIRQEVSELVSNELTIPSFGGAESLNAAMAMAIVSSEIRRKLPFKG